MKLIIAGSRKIEVDDLFIDRLFDQFGLPTKEPSLDGLEIVCGKAMGIDTCGEVFAINNNLKIHEFEPDYETYGGRAPLVRNSKMAAVGDALLLIWDGKSKGSQNMKTKMLEKKKPVYEVVIRSYNG